jgi:hypothetical protein
MRGTKALISQLDISMGQSIGLSISQQDNSICSQQGISQFSMGTSGETVMSPTRMMEIVDMIDLHIV